MVCKIADFYIEITNNGQVFHRLCRDYICDNPPYIDFSITVTADDVAYEKSLAKKYTNDDFGDGICATTAAYRKICAEVLQRDAFLMHGCLIEYKNKGYLFTANSGTGKTTHVMQWKKAFGEESVKIINGDKPIIRFIDGKVYAYGTPWNGKEHYGTNGKVELSAIAFLKRSPTNSACKISLENALPLIFSQIMITDSADLARQMELVNTLGEKVSMYEVNCNISAEAAEIAYREMNK
ncbi:MAG: hypothetical protein E7598_05770 [Ruminococcaceae bacterium]|nr:hypothetical protein [Oscillospiraceae bacterium]